MGPSGSEDAEASKAQTGPLHVPVKDATGGALAVTIRVVVLWRPSPSTMVSVTA